MWGRLTKFMEESMAKFVVMTAAAKMPSSVKARYRRVAVVETDGESVPRQIHPNHRAVKRIVRTWERLNVGLTTRSAYYRALAEANVLAAQLNAE